MVAIMQHLGVWLRRQLRVLLPAAPYIVVALVVMGPLLLPGYIFALDMVFTPTMPSPTAITSSYVPQVLLHGLSLVVPAWLVQKIVLLAILIGSGVGAHRLLGYWKPRIAPGDWRLARYAGGLLYMVNPFVYSRFMAGQYYVLLGYMILPFFARALWRFITKPDRTAMLQLACLTVGISVVSLHTLGIALLLAAIVTVVSMVQRWHDRQWLRDVARYTLAMAGIVLVASSYWIIALAHGGSQAALANSFTIADRTAFATSHDGLGLLGNVAGLQGFWADAQSLYVVPQDVFSWWWLPCCLLWLVVLGGVVHGWRAQRAVTIVAFAAIVLAGLLAAGTPLSDWLAAHAPFFAGYREPQKFVALIALSYAWLASMGVYGALGLVRQVRIVRHYVWTAYIALAVLPFLCTPLMLWGFDGQLRSTAYPVDWYIVNAMMQRDGMNGERPVVLSLPWHAYMRLGFAGNVVANPTGRFFDATVITNTDPEFGGAQAYTTPASVRAMATVLAQAPGRTDFAGQLAAHHVGYVLLLNESDYHQYAPLLSQPGLKHVVEGKNIQLYKVEL